MTSTLLSTATIARRAAYDAAKAIYFKATTVTEGDIYDYGTARKAYEKAMDDADAIYAASK